MLRKLLGALILLVALSASAAATGITIQSFTIPNSHGYTGTVKLRVWYTGCNGTTFLDSTGAVVFCGSPGASTGFFVEIPVTVNSSTGTITVPAFGLYSTDDSSQLTPRATAIFFVNNARRDNLFTNWVITATLGTPVTFIQLYNYQPNALPSPPPATYLTAPQISALIAASVGSLNKATISPTYGVTSLTVAPSNSTDPIAVGENDPKMYARNSAEFGTNLGDALAVLNGGNPVKLVVSTACFITSNQTVQSNVQLVIEGNGEIAGSGATRTLTIQGPLSAPLYDWVGSALVVSFSGNPVLTTVYPEWWGAKTDGVVASASISASSTTITCAACGFTSVDIGKLVDINGAGTPNAGVQYYSLAPLMNANLVGTIAGVTNATTATISVAAGTTVVGAQIVYGTNDRAAIAAALTSLPSSGGSIHFSSGRYIVGSMILLNTSNVTLSGEGPHSSVLWSIGPVAWNGATTYHLLNVNNGVSNTYLRNLGMSGTNALGELNTFGSDVADGLYICTGAGGNGCTGTGNITNVIIQNCDFGYFWGIGAHAPGSGTTAGTKVTYLKAYNSVAHDNSYDGWNLNPYDGMQLENCNGTNNGTGGSESAVQGSININGGIYSNNRLVGVVVGGFGSNVIAASTVINGIEASFNGNHVANSVGVGISAGGNAANVTITNNNVRHNDLNGISSDPSVRGLVIANNTVVGNGLIAAISAGATGVSSSGQSAVISNNLIYDDSTYNIITATRTSNVVTISFGSVPHPFLSGETVVVAGVTGATSFNGTFTITGVTVSTFTYAQVAANDSGTGGTATDRALGFKQNFGVAVGGQDVYVTNNKVGLHANNDYIISGTGGIVYDDPQTHSNNSYSIAAPLLTIKFLSVTTAPGAQTINANTCTENSVALTGAQVGAAVTPSATYALEAGLISPAGYVSATGTVKYRICNVTVGNITTAVGSAYNLIVRQ